MQEDHFFLITRNFYNIFYSTVAAQSKGNKRLKFRGIRIRIDKVDLPGAWKCANEKGSSDAASSSPKGDTHALESASKIRSPWQRFLEKVLKN